MADDTTQESVSQEEESKEEQLSPGEERLKAIEGIADRNFEEQKDEFQDAIYPDRRTPKLEEEETEEPESEERVEEPDPEEKVEEEKAPEEQMMDLIIDGTKQQVPMSKVLDVGQRALQKSFAADRRLEEATRLLNEAKQATQKEELPKEEEKEDTFYKDLAEKVQFGSDTEVAQALEQLHSRNSSKTENFDPNQISSLIDQHLNVRMIQQRFNSPPEDGGFNDIVQDPRLYHLATQMVNDALHKGLPNNWDLYEAIGKDLRAWRGNNSSEANDQGLTQKKERKKTIDNVKPAAAKHALPNENDPESISDILAEIRKARHQL